MGLIEMVFSVLFGNGRNAVKETLEVFRENADAAGQRDAAYRAAALGQFAAEFKVPRRGGFDRFMDGLNRVPRPALAFGTLALFVSAMVNPVWFASRMQGIALVPQPLWWLLGAIVSFYFGARYQVKTQDFQKTLAETLAQSTRVMRNIDALDQLGDDAVAQADEDEDNPALADWRANHAK